jgi:hypothetical protein
MKHEQRTNEFVQRATSMIHAVVEEQHGDLYYWFDQETGVFLAQGKDLPEVTAQLLARFPNHVFVMPGGDYALAGPKMEAILVKDLTKRLSDV